MIRIYFAGSIRGGREVTGRYNELIKILQSHGRVITEHVGDDNQISRDDVNLTDREIHDRDMDWLRNADIMVAEVSVPSLGVGYEIANAIRFGKPLLCLYYKNAEHLLSAMISGCDELEVAMYDSIGQAGEIVEEFIQEHAA